MLTLMVDQERGVIRGRSRVVHSFALGEQPSPRGLWICGNPTDIDHVAPKD
jgi:hypothetical protein